MVTTGRAVRDYTSSPEHVHPLGRLVPSLGGGVLPLVPVGARRTIRGCQAYVKPVLCTPAHSSGLRRRGGGGAEEASQSSHRSLFGAGVRVEVFGGGFKVGVAEEFLDGPDVNSITDEMGGEGVAQ